MVKRFKTDDELKAAIDNYFAETKAKEENPTVTGLALHLGFESRQSFYDYEKYQDHSYTIKRARLMIECQYEQKLHNAACTGAIFALKNFGWEDKREISGRLTLQEIIAGQGEDDE